MWYICTKSSIYFKLARSWTRWDKVNCSSKVISFVYSLWPNEYSQPPDICLISSYNIWFPIVQCLNACEVFLTLAATHVPEKIFRRENTCLIFVWAYFSTTLICLSGHLSQLPERVAQIYPQMWPHVVYMCQKKMRESWNYSFQ